MAESPRAKYPGEEAGAADLLRLADEYRLAAGALIGLGRRGEPISRAPYRLSAIHAVELYLNAVLLHCGRHSAAVRGLQHDLAARAELAACAGLVLRKRTADHLRSLAASREYLLSRYAPEPECSLSQLNRLAATLEEVATKATRMINGKRG